MNQPSIESSAEPKWYKVSGFWSGHEPEIQTDLFLEVTNGIFTEITPTRPARFVDLGAAVMIPRLVNAHCHLEFSHLPQPLTPALPFASWIGQTVAARRINSDLAGTITAGRLESARAGVGLLGEIVTHDQPLYSPAPASPELQLFREFLAFNAEQAREQLQKLREFLSAAPPGEQRGISPHAPYTVCPDFLQDCMALARETGSPVMIHLAETQAELELLARGTGELVEMLRRLDLWQADRYSSGLRPLDYLHELATTSRGLIAHGNYLDAEEIDFLAETAALSVVYCPRTHAFFEHQPHPWQELLRRGINVALGTDGKGSNPDLNLWEEVCFLQRLAPRTPPLTLLKMATLNGGRALGQDVSLQIGQPAVCTLVRRKNAEGKPLRQWGDFFDQPLQFTTLSRFTEEISEN